MPSPRGLPYCLRSEVVGDDDREGKELSVLAAGLDLGGYAPTEVKDGDLDDLMGPGTGATLRVSDAFDSSRLLIWIGCAGSAP